MNFRVAWCLLFLAWANSAAAAIEVVRVQGDVAVSTSVDGKLEAISTKGTLSHGNILSTGTNGRAVVRMGTAGYVVLEKNSKIAFGDPNDHAVFLRQITGMIYYAMKTIKGDQSAYAVRTRGATIGVRGTRFLVTDLPERSEISMRKGLISVTSPAGEFEIHKQAEQDEFEAYKQEGREAVARERRAFEEYKAATAKAFVEYKQEFSLGANRMASFDGNHVEDKPLSAESVKDMEAIESYAAKWLQEVRD
jgi:hypothetical protein